MTTGWRQILTFLFFALLLSSGPYFLFIHAHHLAVGGGLVTGTLMWMPACAAFITCALYGIRLSSLGWGWWPLRFEAVAYLLPLLYATPVYLLCWLLIPHSSAFADFAAGMAHSFAFPNSPRAATFLLGLPILATFGMIRSLSSTLGEEIGWRGFLLPRLVDKLGFKFGCLVSGCIWACWHYPLLLFADYNSGTPKPFALTCFTLMVIGLAFPLGWLRLRSRSLWPCALLHASHNLFVQAVFDRMTAPEGKALYVTTEFGFGMAITCAIVAVICCLLPITQRDNLTEMPAPN